MNGDDFVANTNKLDFYNNRVISTLTTVTAGTNHQDFIQTDGSYMRVWNNYFENPPQYVYFGEYFGSQAGSRYSDLEQYFQYH